MAHSAETGIAQSWPRPLTTDDLQACAALDRLALGGLWNEAQWQRELAEPDRPCLGLGAGPTLVAIATGWVILDELHISLVAVDPSEQRQGLGRRVLEALLLQGQAMGCSSATLEVAAGNGRGQALYGALGFRTQGRRRCYYRSGEDALIQWLSLEARD
ncbi:MULTISPECIES: GNAT family N-acetyltransferase [Synechococcaceae]|uniref:GNAT family N-acetyltransferase n=1 Tax=Synechococcaceae TaxID=1890426 RepID=UPI0021A6E1BB|nr:MULTISPECIES: GNAT family N-acetyltransferase [Synechococcaceae]MCT4363678.1 GNAT family N-acetyltransferase [Candidatus Regnicoccus frigidus MAG-AL1]MCT4366854.1 GNAT family N-acetyltransferase [Candidatus Regnicoccus frigidus MAG-AL2]